MKRIIILLEGGQFLNHYCSDESLESEVALLKKTLIDFKDTEESKKPYSWAIYPDCFFRFDKVLGFYCTDANTDSQERVVKAIEKIDEVSDEGNDWKK